MLVVCGMGVVCVRQPPAASGSTPVRTARIDLGKFTGSLAAASFNYVPPRRSLHSPRTERIMVTPPSAPSAQSVQTKKKPPVDAAISG